MFTRSAPAGPVTAGLFRHGFTVIERRFSPALPELLVELDPDVILASIDAAESEDLAVVRYIAAHAGDRPVLALIDTYTERHAASALDAGAVAVLPATASPDLLGAQATALRRAAFGAATTEDQSQLTAGDLVIDLGRRTVTRRGERIDLTKSEFDIVALLARNPGRVLTPSEIVAGIGQLSTSPGQARGMVKVHVSHLRAKLGSHRGMDYVVTVRGVGYLFEQLPSENYAGPLAGSRALA